LFLTKEGLWHDEAITAISSVQRLPELIKLQFYFGYSPLYLLMVKPIVMIFGNSELIVRLPSALFGILAVYGMYLLSKELFDNEWIINTSTALFSFSALQVHFSQEARPYEIVACAVIFSFYFFIKALEKNRPMDWVLYSIVTFFALHLNILVLTVLLAQFLWTLIKKQGSFEFNLAFTIIILLFSPMVFFYLKMGRLYFVNWLSPLSGKILAHLFYGYFLIPMPFPRTGIFTDIYIFMMKSLSFLLLVPLAAGAYFMIKEKGSKESNNIFLLWMWIFIPVILEILYSMTRQPIMGMLRYLMFLSPALYLLLAYSVWRMFPIDLKKPACIALVIIFSIPMLSYYFIPKREDWRGAISYLKSNMGKKDLVFTDVTGIPLFQYYWGKQPLKLFDTRHLYSINFSSGWVLMRSSEFSTCFGDGSMLKKQFKASEAGNFTDIKLVKLIR
jgi:4-amino-4-deoxy-L-arabinose transferase-like glycosyltransferase